MTVETPSSLVGIISSAIASGIASEREKIPPVAQSLQLLVGFSGTALGKRRLWDLLEKWVVGDSSAEVNNGENEHLGEMNRRDLGSRMRDSGVGDNGVANATMVTSTSSNASTFPSRWLW